MKSFSFSLFNIISVLSILLLIILIVIPFNLINLEQAERIAKWKSEYEKLKYSLELVNLHEGSIVPNQEEIGKIVTEDFMWNRILQYMNVEGYKKPEAIKKYKYRKMNGTFVRRTGYYHFEKFVKTKNGVILGLNESKQEDKGINSPLYFMFVDINGEVKPNRIGQDIFFLSIYKNHVTALGQGKSHARLKADCSPLGRGLYCSEYYLLGGSF